MDAARRRGVKERFLPLCDLRKLGCENRDPQTVQQPLPRRCGLQSAEDPLFQVEQPQRGLQGLLQALYSRRTNRHAWHAEAPEDSPCWPASLRHGRCQQLGEDSTAPTEGGLPGATYRSGHPAGSACERKGRLQRRHLGRLLEGQGQRQEGRKGSALLWQPPGRKLFQQGIVNVRRLGQGREGQRRREGRQGQDEPTRGDPGKGHEG
mmetsp:Transcript_35331/g.79251  ORF Transcript_35331/g.79251 Transcript_35331/m.79251 type:complete len:207 (-) Transcript_35331:253-873(-)